VDHPGQGPTFVVEIMARLRFHQRANTGLVEPGETESFDGRLAQELGHQVGEVGAHVERRVPEGDQQQEAEILVRAEKVGE
jgi:hypothetical protein